MTDPKSDPCRRCMRLSEWPAADRAAWNMATRNGSVLEEGGDAAHWRPHTRKSVIAAYGRYLTFLERSSLLDRSAGPAERLTRDRLRAYVAELETQIAPATVSGRIRGLAEALRVMTPKDDYPYLIMARRRLKARARPVRNKRARLVSTDRLIALGADLMKRAETQPFPREVWRAATYRDGLTILLLALRPNRRSNVADMVIDRHIFRVGDAYALSFEDTETKSHRRYDRPLDPRLTPFIERYLEHYRPILLGNRESDRIWISWRGLPMTDCCLYDRIVVHTRKAFGRSLSPHLFRDAAVTTLGERNPELVWLAMSLLHHADPRIAEKYYNQARDVSAVRRYQEAIRGERRRIRKTRRQVGVAGRQATGS